MCVVVNRYIILLWFDCLANNFKFLHSEVTLRSRYSIKEKQKSTVAAKKTKCPGRLPLKCKNHLEFQNVPLRTEENSCRLYRTAYSGGSGQNLNNIGSSFVCLNNATHCVIYKLATMLLIIQMSSGDCMLCL